MTAQEKALPKIHIRAACLRNLCGKYPQGSFTSFSDWSAVNIRWWKAWRNQTAAEVYGESDAKLTKERGKWCRTCLKIASKLDRDNINDALKGSIS